MNWITIAEMAIANLISGGLIVGGVTVIGNHISNRSLKKLQDTIDTRNMRFNAEISKKNYISKTRFDAEFSIYRELTTFFWQMVLDINVMIPSGYHEVPADNEDRLKLDQQHYEKAQKSVFEAQNALHSNSAFIPKRFCVVYEDLLKMARLQLLAYTRRLLIYNHDEDKDCFTSDDYRRTDDILKKWDEHTDNIRQYLSSLDVIS